VIWHPFGDSAYRSTDNGAIASANLATYMGTMRGEYYAKVVVIAGASLATARTTTAHVSIDGVNWYQLDSQSLAVGFAAVGGQGAASSAGTRQLILEDAIS
jgi:hypothetical protein